jgi:hypothetical protein
VQGLHQIRCDLAVDAETRVQWRCRIDKDGSTSLCGWASPRACEPKRYASQISGRVARALVSSSTSLPAATTTSE